MRNFKRSIKPIFFFGNSMILLYKNARFESIYYDFFRKYLKIIIKKKNITNIQKNYWVFLKLNTPLTKKSKNSRMGKGKGSILRWVFRLPKYYKIFEFKNINFFRLYLFTKKWSKKINLPLAFVSKVDFF